MDYPAYDEYKGSSIEWGDDIPAHWAAIRMRFLCSITTGDKDTENKVENGEFPFCTR